MNNQAGKGPEIRKGANLRAYWDNYDNIFRKEKKEVYILPESLQSKIQGVYQDHDCVHFVPKNNEDIKWPDDLEQIDNVQEFCIANNLKLVN